MLECQRLSSVYSMRVAAPVVASVLCLFAPWACALSLGPVTNAGRLGQPLDFAVAVKLEADETLTAQCVAAEVTAGDQRIAPAQVRTRLMRGASGREATARVSTTIRLNEPVVTVLLTLGCPPKLSHKFVSLLDPPLPTAAPRTAVPPATVTRPDPAVTAPAAAPDEAVTAPIDSAERARQREQLLALEARLARQGQELRTAQESLAATQARLRESEEARRSNPAKYGLLALVLMLSITVAVLLWRLARLERKQRWTADARALTEDVARRESGEAPRSATVHPPFAEATLSSMRVLSDPAEQAPADEPSAAVREAAHQTHPSAARVRQELTADELIDLEQQADFFIVLGQEEAAIDLLMSHVRSSGGTSPMPYLKLLEIYRRRGDGDAYDRIRERFNRRFNAHAPDWESDPKAGRALDAYPEILQRLQDTWPVAARAVDLLEALLFRRDASDGVFDLPAFEELLFLYAVARDVVEHETTSDGVDLLLPLGVDEPGSAIVRADVTRPPNSWLAAAPDAGVDVDLDLDSPSAPPADSQPR